MSTGMSSEPSIARDREDFSLGSWDSKSLVRVVRSSALTNYPAITECSFLHSAATKSLGRVTSCVRYATVDSLKYGASVPRSQEKI